MKIELKNRIDLGDGQTELVREVYEGSWLEKGDSQYLTYHNGDQERVVIRIKAGDLLMTRYGNPQTSMRFLAGQLGLASIPSPMGLQQVLTRTRFFALEASKVSLAYDLLPGEDSQPLASYQLELSWEM